MEETAKPKNVSLQCSGRAESSLVIQMKSIVIYIHSGGGGGMPGRLRETVSARRSRASFPQPARHSPAPIRSGGVTALRGSSSSRKPPPPPPATRVLCFSTVCDIRKEIIKPKTFNLHSLSLLAWISCPVLHSNGTRASSFLPRPEEKKDLFCVHFLSVH